MWAVVREKMQGRDKPDAVQGTRQQKTLAHWPMKNIKLSPLCV